MEVAGFPAVTVRLNGRTPITSSTGRTAAKTKLGNLVLLCRRHHRQVHEQGWRLVSEMGGSLQALPP